MYRRWPRPQPVLSSCPRAERVPADLQLPGVDAEPEAVDPVPALRVRHQRLYGARPGWVTSAAWPDDKSQANRCEIIILKSINSFLSEIHF